ncbi:TetR/AcrR family transcriptional regulator C-terminal domain-containing protein [Secundilactobacillus similis DSM 23365 = JCM 2765]|uniref:TetR/AcrR family transcriptional regulator n=1 Tax=Secundilactobacillus similis TaxID=414682 RepID=UPI001F325C84|nr:TetR-like C-terminal domain-containing protein [Secundilactobacillus similis]
MNYQVITGGIGIATDTKLKLAQAFKTLLETMPLNKVTIDILTQRADVTRNTFYYHFEDIYALLEWTLQHDVLDQLAHYRQLNTWQGGLDVALDYIADNRQFCRHLFQSVGRDLLEQSLYAISSEMVEGVVLDIQPDVAPFLKDAITNFYGWALVMQFVQWLNADLAEPKATVIQRVELMLNGSVELALKNGQQLSQFGQTD